MKKQSAQATTLSNSDGNISDSSDRSENNNGTRQYRNILIFDKFTIELSTEFNLVSFLKKK